MRFSRQLLVDDRPVGPLAVADSYLRRLRGFLGTRRPAGALLLVDCNGVHGFGMLYPLDVALLTGDPADGDLTVQAIATLPPFGLVPPRRGVQHTLEARRGAFADWGLQPGSVLRTGHS